MDAEARLAEALGPHLPRGAEAKRVMQNLFCATGSPHVGPSAITVRLDPSANGPERAAIERLLELTTQLRLVHPGDSMRRPLRFTLQPTRSAQAA